MLVTDVSPINVPPSINVRSTTARKANYRPLPTKKATAIPVKGTKKRKHSAGPPPVQYFEDESTGSEDDAPRSFDGDGSSSGESVRSDAPGHTKRQRTSKVVTRSSIRTPATDEGTRGLDSTPPSPAITVDTLNVAAPMSTDNLSTSAATTFIDSPDLQSTNIPASSTNVDTIPNGCISRASSESPNSPDDDAAELAVESTAARVSATPVIAPHSPPAPALSNDIDLASVPAFLRRHGKGRRQVDIFQYLNAVKDPHFQQILVQYIRIEANDKSGVSGSLSTTGRPAEIGDWSSKARPAILPDFTKGKRSLSDFVDSVLAWWNLIQPSWRSFQRGGEVSRVVCGEWETLYAPRINGLLNVVVLAYWWAGTLEKQGAKGSDRADYEEFASDVAWVFSKFSS